MSGRNSHDLRPLMRSSAGGSWASCRVHSRVALATGARFPSLPLLFTEFLAGSREENRFEMRASTWLLVTCAAWCAIAAVAEGVGLRDESDVEKMREEVRWVQHDLNDYRE